MRGPVGCSPFFAAAFWYLQTLLAWQARGDDDTGNCVLTSVQYRRDVLAALQSYAVDNRRPFARCIEIGSNSGCVTETLLQVCDLVFAMDIEVHLHSMARKTRFRRSGGDASQPSRVVYLTMDSYSQPWWQFSMLNDVELVVVDAVHDYKSVRLDILNAASIPTARMVLFHDYHFIEVHFAIGQASVQGYVHSCRVVGELRPFEQHTGKRFWTFDEPETIPQQHALGRWQTHFQHAESDAEGVLCQIGRRMDKQNIQWAMADYVQSGAQQLWPEDIMSETFGTFALYSPNIFQVFGLLRMFGNGTFTSPLGQGCYTRQSSPLFAGEGVVADEILLLCGAGTCADDCSFLGYVSFTFNRQGLLVRKPDGSRLFGLRMALADLPFRLIDQEMDMRSMR